MPLSPPADAADAKIGTTVSFHGKSHLIVRICRCFKKFIASGVIVIYQYIPAAAEHLFFTTHIVFIGSVSKRRYVIKIQVCKYTVRKMKALQAGTKLRVAGHLCHHIPAAVFDRTFTKRIIDAWIGNSTGKMLLHDPVKAPVCCTVSNRSFLRRTQYGMQHTCSCCFSLCSDDTDLRDPVRTVFIKCPAYHRCCLKSRSKMQTRKSGRDLLVRHAADGAFLFGKYGRVRRGPETPADIQAVFSYPFRIFINMLKTQGRKRCVTCIPDVIFIQQLQDICSADHMLFRHLFPLSSFC